jgi:nucleoside-diphosphate-sugar epimerase
MRQPVSVLATGHKGYIGSMMTPVLVEAGWDVVLDCNFFRACSLLPDAPTVPSVEMPSKTISTFLAEQSTGHGNRLFDRRRRTPRRGGLT